MVVLLYCCIAVLLYGVCVCRVRVYVCTHTIHTGLTRDYVMCVTDSYRVESAGYTLKSSENEFKFMALQSRKVNEFNEFVFSM